MHKEDPYNDFDKITGGYDDYRLSNKEEKTDCLKNKLALLSVN